MSENVHKKIYILGAGAMAREVFSIYKDLGKSDMIFGFIEENCRRKGVKIYGKPIYDSSIIGDLAIDETLLICAIGSPKRKRWVNELENRGFNFDTVIHPTASIGLSVNIGTGCIICQNVVLTCDIEIGKHTIVNVGSTISHDCRIGNFVTISPGVNIGGRVIIEEECFIGIGAKIKNDVKIGKGCFIGAGAVVVDDIPKNTLAIGVPAKPIKKLTDEDWKRII